MSKFDIELDNGAVLSALNDLVQRGRNLAPAMREISEAMKGSIDEAFAAEADPVTGDPWAPLSPVSIEQRGGDAHPILQRSGQLATSFSTYSGADFAMAGTNKEYALVQQLGAQKGEFGTTADGHPIPWGDIPARPMAGFSDDLEEEILDILSRHLVGG